MCTFNGPFSLTVMMTRLNGHLYRKSCVLHLKFFIFNFFRCIYIYNTIFCVILPLHQITKRRPCLLLAVHISYLWI